MNLFFYYSILVFFLFFLSLIFILYNFVFPFFFIIWNLYSLIYYIKVLIILFFFLLLIIIFFLYFIYKPIFLFLIDIKIFPGNTQCSFELLLFYTCHSIFCLQKKSRIQFDIFGCRCLHAFRPSSFFFFFFKYFLNIFFPWCHFQWQNLTIKD
ncbi:uncharacterized protein SCDLUD_001024 [Saccharomycodes ludwigii]|uniref:uncharacterized protein n=1 Tax=Saccharomycodes ludwigii TaxID=36035 RepID=UPI001E847FBD|nr:hypothetical protein SCDLUD_001024 [Saccharomycodes ludwigii]KAH3903390.1 hypothetical protein SCDLUD_001024 [Saccharomycodes ludwigii]